MKYKGYTITRTRGGNYRVKTPWGSVWAEEAANIATAKKWIDADIREKQAYKPATWAGELGPDGMGR